MKLESSTESRAGRWPVPAGCAVACSRPSRVARAARAVIALAIAGLVGATALPASAAEGDTKVACASAHEDAQLLMQKGALLQARTALRSCGRDECPALLRGDCMSMLSENEHNVPSIVIRAVADEGDLIDVTVRLDGKEAATRLTGAPLDLDPGAHQLELTAPGRAPIAQTILVRAGEKNRPVTVSWATKKESTGTTEKPAVPMVRPVPALTYVFAGLGVVGAAGFVYFGSSGNDKKSSLDGCAPVCAQSDVDEVKRDYLFANVALGVGGAGLIAAAVVFLTRPERPRDPVPSAAKLTFLPGTDGGRVVWGGAF